MWLPCGSNELALAANEFCSERAWWTGKDSNLRSPQGAADLQSAGFSHSPTRPAKSFGMQNPHPAKLFGREPRVPNFFFNNFQTFTAKTQIGLVSRDTSPLAFAARFRSALLPSNSGGAGGGN